MLSYVLLLITTFNPHRTRERKVNSYLSRKRQGVSAYDRWRLSPQPKSWSHARVSKKKKRKKKKGSPKLTGYKKKKGYPKLTGKEKSVMVLVG